MWIEVKNQNQGNYPGVSNVNLLDLATGNTIYPYKNRVIYAFPGFEREEPFNTEPESLARYEEIKGLLLGKGRNLLKLNDGNLINLDNVDNITLHDYDFVVHEKTQNTYSISYEMGIEKELSETFFSKEERDKRYSEVLKKMGCEE